MNPFSPCLFVFCNKKRDKLKILKWDHNGFWLFYRRLEKGKFQWPTKTNVGTMLVTSRELDWLLGGLSMKQEKAHPKVEAEKIL